MSIFQSAYAMTGFISFVLGIVFFFVDGMLLLSIGFIVLTIMLVLIRMIWNIAGWADIQSRKYFD